MAASNWIREQEDLDKYGNELLYKVNIWNQQPKNGIQYERLSSQINAMIKNLRERNESLRLQLNTSSLSGIITSQEADRRQRLLDALNTKLYQAERSLSNPGGLARETLMSSNAGSSSQQQQRSNGRPTASGFRPGGASPINTYQDEIVAAGGTSDPTAGDLRTYSTQLVKDQDRGLDILEEIITRQKSLARGIGNEISIHNEIIEDIGDNMDQTHDRLIRNTRNIKRISLKSESCCYWVIIVLLFIAIIVVAFV